MQMRYHAPGPTRRKEEKKKNYHRVERFMGCFYRAVRLSPGADAEKVSAICANGIVTIAIPKAGPYILAVSARPFRCVVTPDALQGRVFRSGVRGLGS